MLIATLLPATCAVDGSAGRAAEARFTTMKICGRDQTRSSSTLPLGQRFETTARDMHSNNCLTIPGNLDIP